MQNSHWPTRVLAAACLLAAMAGTGCKTTGSGVSPAQAFTAPDWDQHAIRTLAFPGLASPTLDRAELLKAESLVETELMSGQTRFVILSRSMTADRLAKAGLKESYDKALAGWKGERKVDQFVAKQLCEKLSVDGLLFGDLDEWREEKVDFHAEGTSFTQVDLHLAIVSADNGLPVWEADKSLREESTAYVPGQAGSGVYEDGMGTTRSGNKSNVTPDAPPIEEVCHKVMTALIEAFPPAPAK